MNWPVRPGVEPHGHFRPRIAICPACVIGCSLSQRGQFAKRFMRMPSPRIVPRMPGSVVDGVNVSGASCPGQLLPLLHGGRVVDGVNVSGATTA